MLELLGWQFFLDPRHAQVTVQEAALGERRR
jgi:hypothetical protein